MSRIRIAQLGVTGSRNAVTADEVVAGLGLRWVEIDGVRIRSVMGATIETVKYRDDPDSPEGVVVDDPLVSPILHLEILGAVEIVYVDDENDPLPSTARTEMSARELPPRLGHLTMVPRPGPPPARPVG